MQRADLSVQHPIVVVAAGDLQLLVVGPDARADHFRLGEIERRAGHRRQFAGRDQRLVHRRKPVGGDFHFLVQDIALVVTMQVEIRVIGQIQYGGLVGGSGVIDTQRAALQRVPHCRSQRSRKSHVAVRAHQRELNAVRNLLRLPYVLIESLGPAMQRVGSVIEGNLVSLAVDRELSSCNAVPVSPDNSAEIGFVVGQVTLQRIVSENNVRQLSRAIRRLDAHQMRSVCHDSYFNLPAGQRVDRNGNSVRGFTEYRHLRLSLCNGGNRHCHSHDECKNLSYSLHNLPLCL